ncbi:MAG: hypothetical protein U0Z53_06365 [Blastocatellia bacterium]
MDFLVAIILLVLIVAQGIGLWTGRLLRIHQVLAALVSGSIFALTSGIFASWLFKMEAIPLLGEIAWLGGAVFVLIALVGFIINFLLTLVLMQALPSDDCRAKSHSSELS